MLALFSFKMLELTTLGTIGPEFSIEIDSEFSVNRSR